MRIGRFQKWLLGISLLGLNVILIFYLESEIQKRSYFSYETGMRHFIAFDVSEDVVERFYDVANGDREEFLSLLALYMGNDCLEAEPEALLQKKDKVLTYHKESYERLYAYLETIFTDMELFPVGEITNLPEAQYSFVNSWQFARNYGGERAHEGCDIMAEFNRRGIYPIYSATDGVVENIGWLKLGGYRIGIRSDKGAYYYYAHLSDYARAFEPGEKITAGTLLGFMGDTGYSEVPGTYGNFDVHLHFGIYFNDENGEEFAVNPYPVLKYIENRQKEALDEN